jgi:hypothetical protein
MDSAGVFAATREDLEFIRRQVEAEMKEKIGGFESLKEYTLWQLNSMSDRTVEIAREERNAVEALLAQDRARLDAELAEWNTRFHERIHDEKFLDRLAQEAVEALLPLPREPGPDVAPDGGGAS